jgi:CheY-like chemotaxis protein
MAPQDDTTAFAEYLSDKRIVIADPSATARTGIFNIMSSLGAQKNLMTLANGFRQAAEQIAQTKPHLVLAEYELGKRCGLDLLQTQREQNPKESKNMVFVVITGNTSQTAVARAAEEDIDAYILKPFTADMVRKTIMKAALAKINPSEYVQTIEAGKKKLESASFEEAEQLFVKALTMDPQPSLACYYLGQTKFLREVMDEARGNYSKGLEFNKIHYKCSIGLYELLMKQKEHAQAYEVVKRISQYFPANPKRLGEVLRLAIMNAKYEDVERYYSIFCNIDDRDETLIKYVCAALVVCGRYYLSNGARSRALELFQKAAATSAGRAKILKEIVQALIDFGLAKECRTFLDKFPPDAQITEEYWLLQFYVVNVEGDPNIIIEMGRGLIQKGIKDEKLYAIMIQRSKENKLDRAVESLLHSAVSLFPDKKEYFEKLSAGEAA